MTEKELFKNLYDQYNDRLSRLCLSLSDDTQSAKDLLQEVYYKIVCNLSKFRKEANIYTWIYRIAINTVLTNRKLESRVKQINTLEIIENSENSELLVRETIQHLHECIGKLKNDEEKILVNMLLENMSYKEISEITGYTVNYVGVRINRVKQKLKKCLEHYE